MTFDTVLAHFEGKPGVERGTNWRSDGLRVHGRIFAMHVDGDLVVKLPAERCSELVAAGRGRPFQSGRRTMREWVAVGDEHAADWLGLAEEAYAFVG